MKAKEQRLQQKDGFLMPMAYPTGNSKMSLEGRILAGDVGGTKTNLALYRIENGRFLAVKEQTYPTADFKSFTDMASTFCDSDSTVDGLCLGVAGPVTQGKVHGTNFPWDIDSTEIAKSLNVPSVSLINDMEANAYGLSALDEKDFEILRPGTDVHGNAAIISPGTGLGEAGLFWDGSKYHPFATEGGHCDYSPRNDIDLELWHFLHQKYGHVSWERVLCGHGIYDIYLFLKRYRNLPESTTLHEKFQKEDHAAVITHEAIEGSDPVCLEALELFTRYLANECAQLGLKIKATGGIYIGGGIVPKIMAGVSREIFHDNFLNAGRMNSLLEMIPVKVVLNPKTALLGAGLYAAMHL